MGTVFYRNAVVTKFNELRLFTGIKVLSYMGYMSNLTEIELPVGGLLEILDDSCFYYTPLPKTMVFPEGITTFANHSVSRSTMVETLDLPSTTESIPGYFAYVCSSLNHIIIRATTPPLVGSNTLPYISSRIQFYVPDEALQSYLNHSSLGSYSSRIHPISEYDAD